MNITTRIAAEIKDFNPENYMDRKKHAEWIVSFSSLWLPASKLLKDANLNIKEDTDPERVGVYVGSGIGGLNTWEEQHNFCWKKVRNGLALSSFR